MKLNLNKPEERKITLKYGTTCHFKHIDIIKLLCCKIPQRAQKVPLSKNITVGTLK